MQRIDTATAVPDLHGLGKKGFRNGNKALGIQATQLDADFFNALQEEIANVVEGAGIALNPVVNTQLLAALNALWQRKYTRDWFTVTGSRSFGAVYTNSTGEDIDVSIIDMTVGAPTYIYSRANSSLPWKVVAGNSTDTNYGWLNFCYARINPNHQYYVQGSGGGLQLWSENRKV